jgi:hypothetical protein
VGYLTTRHAIAKAHAIATDTSLEAPTRQALANQVLELARTTQQSETTTRYQGSIYFLIAALLGVAAILVVVFALVLALNGDTVDSALYAIGSAAVGGLAGVFTNSTSSGSKGAKAE